MTISPKRRMQSFLALSGRTAANAGISRSDSYGYSTEFTRVMDVMVDAEADGLWVGQLFCLGSTLLERFVYSPVKKN